MWASFVDRIIVLCGGGGKWSTGRFGAKWSACGGRTAEGGYPTWSRRRDSRGRLSHVVAADGQPRAAIPRGGGGRTVDGGYPMWWRWTDGRWRLSHVVAAAGQPTAAI